MAQVQRFPLSAPFWSLSVIEVMGVEEREGRKTNVKHLYMLDPSEPSGMVLLKTMPLAPFMKPLDDADEVLE